MSKPKQILPSIWIILGLAVAHAVWISSSAFTFSLLPLELYETSVTVAFAFALWLAPLPFGLYAFRRSRIWLWLLNHIFYTFAFLIIVAISLPPIYGSFISSREKIIVRKNVESIKAALERYAADHDGYYPKFLVGGAFVATEHKSDPLDPLLAKGYLAAYPENRLIAGTKRLLGSRWWAWLCHRRSFLFSKKMLGYIASSADLCRTQREYGDPYTTADVNQRFGTLDDPLMGNCAADQRCENGKYGLPGWLRHTHRHKDDGHNWAALLAGNFYYKARYTEGDPYPTGYDLLAWGFPYYPTGIDALGYFPDGAPTDCRLPDGSGIGEWVVKRYYEEFFDEQEKSRTCWAASGIVAYVSSD